MSACRYRAKIRAIVVAAWPKALHAVAATELSSNLFHSLRSGAMRGLHADGSGCNAWIHLGMIENSIVDPQFWATIQTIRCARDFGDRLQICQAIQSLLVAPGRIPDNCITVTLMHRLAVLGWNVSPSGLISDLVGSFSLFDASIAEITQRAQVAWQYVIAQQVAHRPGFLNLQFADPGDTRAFLRSLASDEQELFHKCLNGAHITQDGKMHCQENGSDQCPYCECTDSRFHRFWVCERFRSERVHLTPDVWKLIPTAPEFLTSYGWSIRPSTMFDWQSYLNALQVPETNAMDDLQRKIHLFTDGSCLNQGVGVCRVASWAVVLADDVSTPSQILASGPLPGLLQSSYRAEIYAVWKCLCLVRRQTSQIFIWTDCQAVVERLRKLLRGTEPKPNSSNADLWIPIFECLCDFDSDQIQIAKVAAHRTQATAISPLEEWGFANNSLADQAANWAQWQRPAFFWKLFEKHVVKTNACHSLSRAVQTTLLKISKAVVRDADVIAGDERDELGLSPPVPIDAWRPVGVLAIPGAAVRWYGDEAVRSMLSWFWQSTCQSTFPVVWVSQFQLYIDYLKSGEMAPTKLDRWKAGRQTPHVDLLAVPFQTRTRWFSKVLRESLRHLGHQCTYHYCRPHSSSLFLHTGCLALPWCPDRLAAVDDWFLEMCPGGIRRSSKALERLPLAVKDVRFHDVYVSCA